MIHFRSANQEPYEHNNENFIHLEERASHISFRWGMFSQTTNINIQWDITWMFYVKNYFRCNPLCKLCQKDLDSWLSKWRYGTGGMDGQLRVLAIPTEVLSLVPSIQVGWLTTAWGYLIASGETTCPYPHRYMPTHPLKCLCILWVFVCMQESCRAPGTEVRDGCKPPMGTWNRTWVLSRRSKCS